MMIACVSACILGSTAMAATDQAKKKVKRDIDINKLPRSEKIHSIPLPPAGQRWILNETLSDEFNGTELDKSKWLDEHPTWKGREPGLFQAENVAVEDGYLKLWGKKLDEPVEIKSKWSDKVYKYTMGCAAVVSKEQNASFGYYEARFKASKSYLSTTYWMSTRGKAFEIDDAEGRFSQELDVCECIGASGDFKGKFFADGMNSNTHFWYTGPDKKKQDLRGPKWGIKIKGEKKPSEAFQTYGCWYRSAKTATFYLNNGEGHDAIFNNSITKEPFPHPMGVNMVSETYPFPWIALPTDEQLADKEACTSLYDWVRAYVLKPIAKKVAQEPTVMFDEHVSILNKVVESTQAKIKLDVAYTANEDRDLLWEVFDNKGMCIKKGIKPAHAGYGHYTFDLPVKMEKDEAYAVVCSILPKGVKNRKKAFESDSYMTLRVK